MFDRDSLGLAIQIPSLMFSTFFLASFTSIPGIHWLPIPLRHFVLSLSAIFIWRLSHCIIYCSVCVEATVHADWALAAHLGFLSADLFTAPHSSEGLMPPYQNFNTQADALNFQFMSTSAK